MSRTVFGCALTDFEPRRYRLNHAEGARPFHPNRETLPIRLILRLKQITPGEKMPISYRDKPANIERLV